MYGFDIFLARFEGIETVYRPLLIYSCYNVLNPVSDGWYSVCLFILAFGIAASTIVRMMFVHFPERRVLGTAPDSHLIDDNTHRQ